MSSFLVGNGYQRMEELVKSESPDPFDTSRVFTGPTAQHSILSQPPDLMEELKSKINWQPNGQDFHQPANVIRNRLVFIFYCYSYFVYWYFISCFSYLLSKFLRANVTVQKKLSQTVCRVI